MIARPHLAHQRIGHGRHAGRRRARGFGAFEQRHALFEHRDGRIAEAAVLIAFVLAGEAAFGDFRAVVDKPLRQEQSLGGLAIARAIVPPWTIFVRGRRVLASMAGRS